MMAAMMGSTMIPSTRPESRYEPEVTGPARKPRPPLWSAIHSSTGLAAGTSTITPHRP